jgi:hypothetical protein
MFINIEQNLRQFVGTREWGAFHHWYGEFTTPRIVESTIPVLVGEPLLIKNSTTGNGWELADCGWDLAEYGMRSSRVVRASDCQCRSRNSPGFDPCILRHSGFWGAADEAVFNTVHRKKNPKNLAVKISTIGKKISSDLYVCLLLQASFVPALVGVSAVLGRD